MQIDADFSVPFRHRLRCTQGTFDVGNPTLAELIEPLGAGPAKVVVFVDRGVARANAGLMQQIDRYAAAHADVMTMTAPPQQISGGESVKNNPHKMEGILQTIDRGRICRRSYVIVIGGGAVLDTVGFAAAMAHRGVRLIRVSTTVLGQADSAIGVKNGINAFGRKNYLGTFEVPWAVINDEKLLETLTDRDWIAGFSETVKVALLKDAELFERIERDAQAIHQRDMAAAVPVIRRSAQLHFEHITKNGDPFERLEARPLDFGHWAAHKLEQMTDYEVRHGEAVAIGLALDNTYAHLMGWIDAATHRRILDSLIHLGLPITHRVLGETDVLFDGLEEFREHLGGQLTIAMIRGIAQPFDAHEINRQIMAEAVAVLADWRNVTEAANAG